MRPANLDETERPAFVLSELMPAGTIPWHSHRRSQLAYVSEGAITVRTDEGMWVAPPERAVWILPRVRHSLASTRPFRLCTLYVEPDIVTLPPRSTVVAVTTLVRELLLAAAVFGFAYEEGSAEERLIRVVLDRLPTLQAVPLYLPEPKSQRLRRLTSVLERDPSDTRPLADLAETVGITARTAERLFHAELGMTFGRWRQQLRLLSALELLARGESVTNVAFDVGYEDVSSFIAMFKSSLGMTPSQYFRSPGQGQRTAKGQR